jgi:hypothetical protein
MRYASVLGAALVATLALLSLPALAQQFFLVTPEEIALHLDSVPLQRGFC